MLLWASYTDRDEKVKEQDWNNCAKNRFKIAVAEACVWSGIDQAARLPPASRCVRGLTPTSCAAQE